MPGAARFLYGLALGISLGIIGSKLVAASSSGPRRRAGRNGRFHGPVRVAAKERERAKQEAAGR